MCVCDWKLEDAVHCFVRFAQLKNHKEGNKQNKGKGLRQGQPGKEAKQSCRLVANCKDGCKHVAKPVCLQVLANLTHVGVVSSRAVCSDDEFAHPAKAPVLVQVINVFFHLCHLCHEISLLFV